MYLSASTMQAKPGRAGDVRAAALELARLLDQAGGTGSSAWSAIAGAPFGAFMVSSRFDTMGDYTDAMQRLLSNPEFASISKNVGDALFAPAELHLNRVVLASDGYEAKPFVSVTNTVVAAGKFSQATQWCGEMLEFVSQAAGTGGLLLGAAGGRVGSIGFVFGADDAADWQARTERMTADPRWAEMFDRAGGLFEAGADQRVLMSQL